MTSAAVVASLLLLVGCASMRDGTTAATDSSSPLSYGGAADAQTVRDGLLLPPDLTRPTGTDNRFQRDVVNAKLLLKSRSGEVTVNGTMVNFTIERDGAARWLHIDAAPTDVWADAREYLRSLGFTLTHEDASLGLLETDWREQQADIPDEALGAIRSLLRRTMGQQYVTTRLDRFRFRIEPAVAGGADVFVSHSRLEERFVDQNNEKTRWTYAAPDTDIETAFLYQFVQYLGADEAQAQTIIADAEQQPEPVVTAPIVTRNNELMLAIDDTFARVWRKVGWALDRAGFVIEDRNRSQGVYFVRIGERFRERQSVWQRLTNWAQGNDPSDRLWQVTLLAEGEQILVVIRDEIGDPLPTGDTTSELLEQLFKLM